MSYEEFHRSAAADAMQLEIGNVQLQVPKGSDKKTLYVEFTWRARVFRTTAKTRPFDPLRSPTEPLRFELEAGMVSATKPLVEDDALIVRLKQCEAFGDKEIGAIPLLLNKLPLIYQDSLTVVAGPFTFYLKPVNFGLLPPEGFTLGSRPPFSYEVQTANSEVKQAKERKKEKKNKNNGGGNSFRAEPSSGAFVKKQVECDPMPQGINTRALMPEGEDHHHAPYAPPPPAATAVLSPMPPSVYPREALNPVGAPPPPGVSVVRPPPPQPGASASAGSGPGVGTTGSPSGKPAPEVPYYPAGQANNTSPGTYPNDSGAGPYSPQKAQPPLPQYGQGPSQPVVGVPVQQGPYPGYPGPGQQQQMQANPSYSYALVDGVAVGGGGKPQPQLPIDQKAPPPVPLQQPQPYYQTPQGAAPGGSGPAPHSHATLNPFGDDQHSEHQWSKAEDNMALEQDYYTRTVDGGEFGPHGGERLTTFSLDDNNVWTVEAEFHGHVPHHQASPPAKPDPPIPLQSQPSDGAPCSAAPLPASSVRRDRVSGAAPPSNPAQGSGGQPYPYPGQPQNAPPGAPYGASSPANAGPMPMPPGGSGGPYGGASQPGAGGPPYGTQPTPSPLGGPGYGNNGAGSLPPSSMPPSSMPPSSMQYSQQQAFGAGAGGGYMGSGPEDFGPLTIVPGATAMNPLTWIGTIPPLPQRNFFHPVRGSLGQRYAKEHAVDPSMLGKLFRGVVNTVKAGASHVENIVEITLFKDKFPQLSLDDASGRQLLDVFRPDIASGLGSPIDGTLFITSRELCYYGVGIVVIVPWHDVLHFRKATVYGNDALQLFMRNKTVWQLTGFDGLVSKVGMMTGLRNQTKFVEAYHLVGHKWLEMCGLH